MKRAVSMLLVLVMAVTLVVAGIASPSRALASNDQPTNASSNVSWQCIVFYTGTRSTIYDYYLTGQDKTFNSPAYANYTFTFTFNNVRNLLSVGNLATLNAFIGNVWNLKNAIKSATGVDFDATYTITAKFTVKLYAGLWRLKFYIRYWMRDILIVCRQYTSTTSTPWKWWVGSAYYRGGTRTVFTLTG